MLLLRVALSCHGAIGTTASAGTLSSLFVFDHTSYGQKDQDTHYQQYYYVCYISG